MADRATAEADQCADALAKLDAPATSRGRNDRSP
jgi:hypothetical protein